MQVRPATRRDEQAIRNVHRAAFPEEERERVADLAAGLLVEASTPSTVSLVAETSERVVGHIAFSPVTFDGAAQLRGYILAPLGVNPEHQGQHVGTRLVKAGIHQLSEAGVDLLLVYGDPKFYGRFGFSAETADGFDPPYPLTYPFGWLAAAFTAQRLEGVATRTACVGALRDPALW